MKKIILIFVSIFSMVFASQALTYTVTSNADAGAGAGLTGDLRYCINQAAGSIVSLPHTIIFSSAMTIAINSDLQINAGNHNGITINGFVDAVDGPDVIIRSTGAFNNQMIFNGTVGAQIYGLVFQNLNYGINLNGATTCSIQGCYFGTNAAGTAIVNGINQSGVFIQNGGNTSNNIIGGLLTNLPQGIAVAPLLNNSGRCIFAGCSQKTNAGAGVRVAALQVKDSWGTQVVNNYFGVDITGLVRLGNGNQVTKLPLAHSNIYMNNAQNSLIVQNVIAAATGSGIHLENWCSNTKIKGNKIGTNAAGTAAYNATNALSFSNEAAGIFIQGGTGMVIGYDVGPIANERNIISGNGGAQHNNWQQTCDAGFSDYNQFGIYSESLGNSIIKGNYIGTDVTGNSSGVGNVFGNRAGGIKMVSVTGVGSGSSQNNIIGGGTTANDLNIISGNGYLWQANINSATCNGGVASSSGMVGGPGLLLQYANTSSNTVSGNYVGLGADGATALGNNANGIELQGAASNNIGTPGVPNYICNNTWGIFLQVDFGSPYVPAKNNIIAGNVIGLTPSNAVLGNGVRASLTGGGGIGMQMGVNGNQIGTSIANGGNVISGNRIGISIETNSVTAGATAPTGNIIYNNIIGLDPTGTIAKPNTENGIVIDMGGQGTVFPFGNTIGGTGANQANTISSNQKSGVYISNATAITPSITNSIIGNNIGTNSVGSGNFGNTSQGIEIINVSKSTITSNVISNNNQNGISLTGTTTNNINLNTINTNTVNGIFLTGSSTNTILTNTITSNTSNGIALTNTSSFNTIQGNTISSNTANGISLATASASNIIGGLVGDANTISTNGANGILVNGVGTINNSIHKNSFSCNVARGIVLSGGGNGGYAAPTITGTPTQIIWSGLAGAIIEVFETDGCASCPSDPTRLQGKKLINSGTSPYTFNAGQGFDKTKTYTATASVGVSGAHNTSEFSQCYTLCQDPTSVTITGAPLTFCAGGSVTLTANIVGGTGTETYVWKLNGSVIGGNTTTLVATAAGSYTVDYSSTTTCSTTTSAGVVVKVNPRPTITSAATGTICSGNPQNYTITSSISSTFSWSRALVAGISPATGSGSTNTIAETLINSTTSPVVVEYLITPTSTTGSCPSTTPFSYKVTVNPAAIVSNQTPAAICSGQSFSVAPAGVPAGTTYTWGTPTVTGSITGSSAQATGQTSISQTLTNTGTTVGTVVYTVTPLSGTCTGATFTVTVTVNPNATVSNQTPAAICSGQSFSVAPAGVPAGTTYTWGTPTVTGSITGSSAQATGQTSISQTLTNTGTTVGTVVYTVTPLSGTCTGVTFTVTVTVNPVAIVSNQTPASICSGSSFSVAPAGVPAGTTFTWGAPTVTGSITGSSAQATGQTSISQTLTNTGTTVGTVVYTVTPLSGTCTGATFTVTVTVNPNATVSNQTPAAICSGSSFSVTPAGVPAGTTYTWGAPTVTGSITGSSAQATGQTSISQTLTNTSITAGTVVYTVTPLSGTCTGSTFTVTVTVNPVATVSNQTPAAICSGSSFSVTPAGVPAGTTYTWGAPTVTGSITGSSAQATGQTSISQTLTNTSITAGTVVYTVTPLSGTCTGSTFTVTVTVNPVPTVINQTPAAICSGQSFTVSPTGVPAGTTYTWTTPSITGDVAGAVAQSIPQSSISQSLTNNLLTDATIVYTVTPTSGTCDGATFNVTVTLKAQPGIADQKATICSGNAFKVEPTVGVPAGTTYTWANPTGTDFTGGSAQATPQTSISQTLANSGNVTGIATYIVTPSSSSCGSSTFMITVTVNPNPSITSSATDNVCSDSPQNYSITSNVASGLTWNRALVTGISNAPGSGTSSTITETLKNTTTDAIDVVYIITPTSTAGSCPGAPFKYIVTVNPKAVLSVSASGPTAICSVSSVNLTAVATGFTTGTFEWFNGSTSLGNTNPLTVNTVGTYTAVYTGTSTCKSDPSAGISITINPNNSVAAAGKDFSTCLGNASLVGNIPDFGTGAWSVATGYSATITTGLDPNLADASGLVDGSSYKFVYTVSGACGDVQRDTIEIHAGLLGLLVDASGPSDTLCVTKSRNLFAQATGGSGDYTYVWISSDASFSKKTSDKNIVVQPVNNETIYTVYVIDNKNPGCRTNDATVKVEAVKSQNLYIPNLITPNGDGLNETFHIKDSDTGLPMLQEGSHVEIVNRWGSRVFEANNYDNKWVPTDVTDGMYYYHVTSSCGNKEYKSWLQILGNTKN
jgi:parallel beta-helix repeat protein